MEIDITSLAEMDAFTLSHSRAEGGQDAGRDTWNASLEQAEETPLLDTPEKLEALREFAKDSGGWTEEEIAAWSERECNALFLQWIAGDVRQFPAKLDGVTYEERSPGQWYAEDDEFEWGPCDSRLDAHEAASPGHGFSHAEDLESVDWDLLEEAQQGNAPSNIYKGDDGRIYFYLGN